MLALIIMKGNLFLGDQTSFILFSTKGTGMARRLVLSEESLDERLGSLVTLQWLTERPPLTRRFVRYSIAVAAIALSALLRWALPDILSRAPYLGFYPAVVVAAIFGGIGPGIMATFGSLLLVNFIFRQFDLHDYGLQMRNVIWIIGSTGVSLLAGGLRAARAKADAKTIAVQVAEAALLKSEQIYRAIGETINYGVWICAPDGRNMYASESFLRLVGITQKQCSDFGWGNVLHPDDAERTIAAWQECVRTEGTWDIEHRFRGVDGQWHHILARGVPIRDEDGHIVCWAGINLDIGRLKQTEAELTRLNEVLVSRNRELEVLNKELESFAYSISHDLRGPVRSVGIFSELLLEEYQNRLDAQGKDYIIRIWAGGKKMKLLIDDLLRLARVSRQEVLTTTVNLSALASAAIASLKESDPDRAITVSIAESVTAVADEGLMAIVIENLLGNAWKFTSKMRDAHIEFGELKKSEVSHPLDALDDHTVYYVRDNGTGFNPKYKDEIFRPFHRLHSEDEFEGTGVGLAIVERIIRRHGGRIWAEGEVGKGATIYFMLK